MTKKSEGDPRLNPLREELAAIYQQNHGTPYLHAYGPDGMALKRMLATYSPEQIKAAWVKGLTTSVDFERVYNLRELAGKFTRLVAKPTQNPAVYREPTFPVDSTDPKDAPFGKCSVCEKGAWAMLHVPPNRPFGGAPLAPFCASEDDTHLKAQMRGAYWPGVET